MRWMKLVGFAFVGILSGVQVLEGAEFKPTTLSLDWAVPLLAMEYPHRVAGFHPAKQDLRLVDFDQRLALFVASKMSGASEKFFVEPESVDLIPPIELPLDEDLEVEVAGEFGASYVAYLPKGYSQLEPPPLILAFPPFGDGQRFIQPLKASAQRLGWVLIGCNGLSNGRNEVFFPTAREIIQDVRRRIVHDRRREVLLGFSGGAMGSYRLSRVFWDEFAGLVALGGWLGVYEDSLTYPPRLAVAMLNGDGDAGARENERRDRKILGDSGVKSKLFRFSGGHTIPPRETIDKALDWLQERWSRETPALGDPQQLLSQAIDSSASGRRNQAVDACLDLILGHASSWQAQTAEDLLARLLVDTEHDQTLSLRARTANTARILYGKARGASGMPSRLIAYLEAGLHLAPGDGLIQSRLAFELYQLDASSARARLLAEQAVSSTPDYWLGHFVRGLLRDVDGDRAGAIADVRQARKQAPNAFQSLCTQILEGWGAN